MLRLVSIDSSIDFLKIFEKSKERRRCSRRAVSAVYSGVAAMQCMIYGKTLHRLSFIGYPRHFHSGCVFAVGSMYV